MQGTRVYGHKGPHPDRRPGQTRQIRRPMEEWTTIHHGVYPAYISWDQFLANQARLADNASDFARRAHGAPRQGCALLAGLVVCGRCGYQMRVTGHPAASLQLYRTSSQLWGRNLSACGWCKPGSSCG
jgi:hypothetical protein